MGGNIHRQRISSWADKLKVLFTVGIFLGSLLLPLLGCELLYYISFGAFHRSLLQDQSSSTGTADTDWVRHLQHFRNPFSLEKKGLRILAIGGSTTYGMGVPAQAAWPHLLEKKLRTPGEVLNLGLLGGNLAEQIHNTLRIRPERFLREHFLMGSLPPPLPPSPGWKDLRPEVVILAPQLNDTAPDLYQYLTRLQSPYFFQLRNFLLRQRFFHRFALSFYLDRWVQKNLKLEVPLSPRPHTPWPPEILAAIKKEMTHHLETLVDLWSPTSQVILVRFPLLFHFQEEGEREVSLAHQKFGAAFDLQEGPLLRQTLVQAELMDHEVMVQVASKKGVPYFSLAFGLQKKPMEERLDWYVDPIHFNARGHELIARELAGLGGRLGGEFNHFHRAGVGGLLNP